MKRLFYRQAILRNALLGLALALVVPVGADAQGKAGESAKQSSAGKKKSGSRGARKAPKDDDDNSTMITLKDIKEDAHGLGSDTRKQVRHQKKGSEGAVKPKK